MCTKHDRLHLKATHYAYARHLEALEDVRGAIAEYEASGTHAQARGAPPRHMA